jgi:hypothetical protein
VVLNFSFPSLNNLTSGTPPGSNAVIAALLASTFLRSKVFVNKT